jgi:hypothetical protein
MTVRSPCRNLLWALKLRRSGGCFRRSHLRGRNGNGCTRSGRCRSRGRAGPRRHRRLGAGWPPAPSSARARGARRNSGSRRCALGTDPRSCRPFARGTPRDNRVGARTGGPPYAASLHCLATHRGAIAVRAGHRVWRSILTGAARTFPGLARRCGVLACALGLALGLFQALACAFELILGNAHSLLGDICLQSCPLHGRSCDGLLGRLVGLRLIYLFHVLDLLHLL